MCGYAINGAASKTMSAHAGAVHSSGASRISIPSGCPIRCHSSSSLIDDTKWCNDFRSFSRSKGPVNASIFRDVRIAWLKWKCSRNSGFEGANAVTVRRPR